MSSKIVHGKKVDLFEWDGTDEHIIICAKSCRLTRTYEVIETTHYASNAKEFTTGMYEWVIELEGYTTILTINATDKTVFDYLLYGGKKTIRMRFTDDAANSKVLQGDVIFPDLTINGDVSDQSTYSMALKGTGAFTLS